MKLNFGDKITNLRKKKIPPSFRGRKGIYIRRSGASGMFVVFRDNDRKFVLEDEIKKGWD